MTASFAVRVADAWISRRARPDRSACEAAADLSPATLVTGASRGIGLALAKRFAEAGDTVVLVARGEEALMAAVASMQARCKGAVYPLAVDLTAPSALQAIDNALQGRGLFVDRLVNNAGIGQSGPFSETSQDLLSELTALNVTVPQSLMRHYLPAMLARGRGGVLNVASLGGLVPGPWQGAYYASKAFLISLTLATAHEVRGQGVRIAVVAPGPVDTGFHVAMGAGEAPYLWLLPRSSPEKVASSAYLGFMLGRRLIIPGLLPTALALALRILPLTISVPLTGLLLQTPGAVRRATREETPNRR